MAQYYDTLIPVDACLHGGLGVDWAVVDCRFDLTNKAWGETAYRAGHLPGAYYAHLETDLSKQPSAGSGRHPLPDWQLFAERLGSWGVHRDTQVLVYDQGNGAFAARLWWLLRSVGHPRVAVLDGGWRAWLAGGGDVDRAIPARHLQHYALAPGAGWVTTPDVQRNLDGAEFVLVDARKSERFVGRQEPVDAVAGHIPGALNYPFERNLDADDRFRPHAELRLDWLTCLQGAPPTSVVHMCGSGVTACHNLLAMEVAGLHGSRLYVGSWSEWIRGDRPLATGPD